MSGFKAMLAKNTVLKRNVNHAYAYVNHLIHLLLNLMPWFIRNLGFRLMMGRAGLHMFIDHDVYMKFPWLVVFVAVALNILSAVTLKSIADLQEASLWLLAGAIAVVTLLNGLRFLIWGVAHRRYPLSLSYPLSSMFFPLMLGVAYWYGETIHATQVAGTALITAGVLWMAFKAERP